MTSATDIRGAVIRAVYDLNHRLARWPTADELAAYLKYELGDVKAALRDLKEARMFIDRQRERRRVWMPWREA